MKSTSQEPLHFYYAPTRQQQVIGLLTSKQHEHACDAFRAVSIYFC